MKPSQIKRNCSKTGEDVRYQEEPSDTRRKLLKWDVKWNVESVWNQTGNVKNRTKILKIARKCPKSPQLFRGKKITVPAIKASDGLDATKHFLYTASKQVAKTHFMALTWPIIVNIGAGCPGQTADLRESTLNISFQHLDSSCSSAAVSGVYFCKISCSRMLSSSCKRALLFSHLSNSFSTSGNKVWSISCVKTTFPRHKVLPTLLVSPLWSSTSERKKT